MARRSTRSKRSPVSSGWRPSRSCFPTDHLLLAEARALPALIVVRLPNGLTHFVLAWRRHGPFVQVMDPGGGSAWTLGVAIPRRGLHSRPARAGRGVAGVGRDRRNSSGRWPLGSTASGPAGPPAALIDAAVADPGWEPWPGWTRPSGSSPTLVRAGGLRRGREARRALVALLGPDRPEAIPERFWSVRPARRAGDDDGASSFSCGGPSWSGRGSRARGDGTGDADTTAGGTSARSWPRRWPSRQCATGRTLLALLRGERPMAFPALAVGLVLVAAGVVFEALLLRGGIDIGRSLRLTEQRLAGHRRCMPVPSPC